MNRTPLHCCADQNHQHPHRSSDCLTRSRTSSILSGATSHLTTSNNPRPRDATKEQRKLLGCILSLYALHCNFPLPHPISILCSSGTLKVHTLTLSGTLASSISLLGLVSRLTPAASVCFGRPTQSLLCRILPCIPNPVDSPSRLCFLGLLSHPISLFSCSSTPCVSHHPPFYSLRFASGTSTLQLVVDLPAVDHLLRFAPVQPQPHAPSYQITFAVIMDHQAAINPFA